MLSINVFLEVLLKFVKSLYLITVRLCVCIIGTLLVYLFVCYVCYLHSSLCVHMSDSSVFKVVFICVCVWVCSFMSMAVWRYVFILFMYMSICVCGFISVHLCVHIGIYSVCLHLYVCILFVCVCLFVCGCVCMSICVLCIGVGGVSFLTLILN